MVLAQGLLPASAATILAIWLRRWLSSSCNSVVRLRAGRAGSWGALSAPPPPTEPRRAEGADWTGAISLEKDVDSRGVAAGRDSCQPAGGRRQNRGTTQPRQNARPRLSARGRSGSWCQAVLTSVRNDALARQETAGLCSQVPGLRDNNSFSILYHGDEII